MHSTTNNRQIFEISRRFTHERFSLVSNQLTSARPQGTLHNINNYKLKLYINLYPFFTAEIGTNIEYGANLDTVYYLRVNKNAVNKNDVVI
jgi:hypothetical protein